MRDAYDIVMLVPGMAFDGDTLTKESLGGSETAGLYMARELAKIGHRVVVFSNTDSVKQCDDVIYMPADRWALYAKTTPHDISIVQRSPEAYINRLASKVNILWQHDMAMGRMRDTFRSPSWNVDAVAVLSDFHLGQHSEVYEVAKDNPTWWKTRNGVDLEAIPSEPVLRDRKHLIYAARPERGLDVLLNDIMPALWERDPEFTLTVYGYDNPVAHMDNVYAELAARMEEMGDRVKHGGHLKKTELYAEYMAAGMYVYPTPGRMAAGFREISCISIMEAQACGLPVITSAVGALPETLADGAGILIDADPLTDEYVTQFVDAIIDYADDDLYNAASARGIEAASNMGWNTIAAEWNDKFDALIDERNDDAVRLAYHFHKRSDIFAAHHALEGQTGMGADLLRAKLDKDYAFTDSSGAFKQHYASHGEGTTAHLSAMVATPDLFDGSQERRFRDVGDRLEAEMDGKPFRMLEYGCGHGWSSIYFGNRMKCEVVGVDVDPGAIASCEKYVGEFADAPSNFKFMQGDEDVDLSAHEKFDVLLVGEVLEHVIDPVALMTKLEKHVKPGGLVILTTPYGPSELGTPNWTEFKNHLWEFELHDIGEMFKDKPGLSVDGSPERINSVNGDVVGYHVTWYRADHEPIKAINLDRKMRNQRPRLTLSANLIAGPGAEKTILMAINSVQGLCDDIVVVDTGLSPLALNMLSTQADVRVIKGSSPITEGFEVPRNEALDASWTDMVLWLDTDECLLNSQNVTKYLRQSYWKGFGIKQHHFTVDAAFDPDVPVRLFNRRCEIDGERIKFYGMIHEHPEAGMNNGPGPVLILPDVDIAHIGYLTENIRRGRFMRNAPLVAKDVAAYPDRLLQKHFVARDLCLRNRYELQSNGGTVTQDMVARAREVCDIYHKHFHANARLIGVNTLLYYSEALTLLGEGVDVTFDLSISRNGVGEQARGAETARFATPQEAKEEIMHRMDAKFAPFETAAW